MVERTSALDGHYRVGTFGSAGAGPGIKLELLRDLVMHQIAAWADSIDQVGAVAARAAGAAGAPGPGLAVQGTQGSLLRIEPLKWWLLDGEGPALDAGLGAVLDLSHSRTRIRVSGPRATDLLNRLLPLDLREGSFPVGSVASSAMHHVGVTMWRSTLGYELLVPRGFALSIWEVLMESALQFGVEVV